MAFTFNWAGFNVPIIQGGSNEYQKNMIEAFGNAGNVLRGYEQRKADQEYADILSKQHRTYEIKARIQQLEQRNSDIRQQIQGIAQTAVAPTQYQPSPAFVSTVEHPTPTNYLYSNELR